MNRSRNALELKGRMLPVTRARLLDADPALLAQQLARLAQQMPQAVRGMPVVLDAEIEADLPALLAALRGVGMQVLAVSAGPLAPAAERLGLPVVTVDGAKPAAAPAGAADPAPPPAATRIVTEPVRSGQQVYAQGGDLVVLSAVSAGAEVIADGCVHVYGRLAGRAIAGARGDERARVFCRKMEAELIAIAGIYAVAEQIKDSPRGKPAQAYLEHGRLVIAPHAV